MRAAAPPSLLLAVPDVTAQPSTASVPTLYYLTGHYNCIPLDSKGLVSMSSNTRWQKLTVVAACRPVLHVENRLQSCCQPANNQTVL